MARKTIAKHYYWNINFTCNSRCIFCASSNLLRNNKKQISYHSFKKALKAGRIGDGDLVTINGGEPTLSADLERMLHCTRMSGAECALFTNGRKFKSKRYAESILRNLKGTIFIPLFGISERSHDRMTGVRNSFKETISGIDNIFRIAQDMNLPVEVELKLLFARPLNNINPKIAKMIADRYPKTKTLSLNTIIESWNVKSSKNSLVPTLKELKKSVNETLNALDGSNIDVSLRTIPLCLLNKKHYRRLLQDRGDRINYRMTYFDPDHPHGVSETKKNKVTYFIYDRDVQDGDLGSASETDRLCISCPIKICCPYRINKLAVDCSATRRFALSSRNRLLKYLSEIM